jgi:tetratricopeptide (TPR) repeat protein
MLACFACNTVASGDDLKEGVALFADGNYPAAKSAFETLQQKDPDHPHINYYLARSYIRERNYPAALRHLEQSLEQDNTNPNAHYLQGIAYISLLNEVSIFKKMSYASKTRKAWQAALGLDSNHRQSRYALASFYMNAPGIAGGDMDRAEAQIEMLLHLHPGYGTLATAILLEKRGQVKEAEEHFVSAVSMIDDRAGPLFNLANFYLRQERFEESLVQLEAYVASSQKSWDDPDDLFVHIVRASIMAGLNDSTSARKELEQALTLNPSKSIKATIMDRMENL